MLFRVHLLVCLFTALASATACASSESSRAAAASEIVAAAQRSLNDRSAGRIEFALTATAEGSDPVGFEIEGRYAFEADRELAVLDLTYRQVLGEESQETRVISDGAEAWVVADDEVSKLTADQATGLEVGEGDSSPAVPALDLAAWLRGGESDESGARATVTGEVHASALIADLQSIAGQVDGTSAGDLDEETASHIDQAVEHSALEVVTERDSLRAVKAVVDFGASVPNALRDALGKYAGATLELSLNVGDVETPLRVRPPE